MLRSRRLVAVPLLATAGLLASCGQFTPEVTETRADVEHIRVAAADAHGLDDVRAATDRLGLEVLGHADDGGNAVISPAGAVIALSMVAEGAEGQTADELDALLGAGGQDRSEAVNALQAGLADWAGDPAVVQEEELPDRPVLHLANSVAITDGAEIEDDYLAALAQHYDAGIQHVDLSGDAGKESLDAWVREHSGGLIEESAIQPGEDLMMAWQNALMLSARWEKPFREQSTWAEEFTLADGSDVRVDTMHDTTYRAYAEHDGWQAVRLPYNEPGLYADVLLPPEGTAPDALDAEGLEALTSVLDADDRVEVELALPKADLASSTDLRDLLADSVPSLVDPRAADLTGISPEPLFVSAGVQQGVLVMDEEGTVAAVVTEIAGDGSAAPPEDLVQMIVDRPYLVRIAADVDGPGTGWTVVLARVADPSASR